MSIDIDWDALTNGADGAVLAESVREFIHDKFQQIALPRFIRSVNVLAFDFGSVPPEVELKDICDPLQDFYEDDSDSSSEENSERETTDEADPTDQFEISRNQTRRQEQDRTVAGTGNTLAMRNGPLSTPLHSRAPSYIDTRLPGLRGTLAPTIDHLGSPLLSRVATPGIPGGTSNLSYFHLAPLGAGLSGAATPLAAMAGAQFQNGWSDPRSYSGISSNYNNAHHRTASSNSLTPPSTADLSSRPTSRHQDGMSSRRNSKVAADHTSPFERSENERYSSSSSSKTHERSVEDVQIVTRIKYKGDIKLSLTAEINLDYPSPSFVGIPLKLNITGLTFDGVAILAYINRHAHFCFLSPEDADTLVGDDIDLDSSSLTDRSTREGSRRLKHGGLLEEIRVESEIGQKEDGKQILKNVGKIEKFVLDQVRRIFEDEFVYPSFWTFLV